MKKLKLASVLTTLILSTNVSAALITHGSLTTDDTTNFITDTDTGREYLRIDTFDLSYDDIITQTSSGGLYSDWSIASNAVAGHFAIAALET